MEENRPEINSRWEASARGAMGLKFWEHPTFDAYQTSMFRLQCQWQVKSRLRKLLGDSMVYLWANFNYPE